MPLLKVGQVNDTRLQSPVRARRLSTGYFAVSSNDQPGDSDRLAIVDISIPTAPTVVAATPVLSVLDASEIVVVDGDYVYAIGGGGAGTFTVVDCSDPLSPAVVGTLGIYSHADELAGEGDYAYYWNQATTTFWVIDVTSKTAPAHAGSVVVPSTASTSGFATIARGDRVYMGGGSVTSLVVFNVANKAAPFIETTVALPGAGSMSAQEELIVEGTLLYSVCRYGIEVFDISSPGAPARLGIYRDTALTLEAAGKTSDHIIAVGGATSLKVFDVSDPTAITLVETYNPGSATFHEPYDITVWGRYVVCPMFWTTIGGWNNQVDVIDAEAYFDPVGGWVFGQVAHA